MVSSSGGRLSVLSFLQCLLGRSKKARQKGEEEQTDKKDRDSFKYTAKSGQCLLTILIYPRLVFVSLTNHGFVPFPPAPPASIRQRRLPLFLQPLLCHSQLHLIFLLCFVALDLILYCFKVQHLCALHSSLFYLP